jgi:DNA-directed RNA polymerase subunit RPC12/RpoP
LEALVRSEGKSCAGKVKFPREDSAQKSAADMMEKPAKKARGEVFEHYKCRYCDGWHIGHRTSFDWIPADHKAYHLLIIQYRCDTCGVEFFTNTVISRRIIARFPASIMTKEEGVICPKCKNIPGAMEAEFAVVEQARKTLSLEFIPLDADYTIEQLWAAKEATVGFSDPFVENENLRIENERLRYAVRNMTGDNLCWITDPEVGKALPREEFMQSCGRYYEQISAEKGVVPPGCRTIAQLEARIVELEESNGKLRKIVQNLAGSLSEILPEEK